MWSVSCIYIVDSGDRRVEQLSRVSESSESGLEGHRDAALS
jgi:hypothetical protein